MNNPKLESEKNTASPAVEETEPKLLDATGKPVTAESTSKPKRKVVPFIVGAVLLLGILYFGRGWYLGRGYESTDDAYVTADIVQVSAEVSGTMEKVLVGDNQNVKAGDELATINADQYQAALLQAQANLTVAKANAASAQTEVTLTQTQGQADILNAQGGQSKAVGALGTSQAQVGALRSQLESARENADLARSDIKNLDQDIVSARQAVSRAQAAVGSAQAAASSARASVDAAKASVTAARAQEDFARKQAARSQNLFNQGAISAQAMDTAQTALANASATRSQFEQQVSAAQSIVAARDADVSSAQAGVRTAQAMLSQAITRRSQGTDKLQVAQSAVSTSLANISAAQQSAASAQGGVTQAQAAAQAASSLPQKVAQKQSQADVAKAMIEQANAAVANAQLNVKRTRITAPIDGIVSKRYALPGSLTLPGSPILSLVPAQGLYVIANFKETQVARMHAGQKVEVEVDSLGGHVFEGEVDSLSAATGSQFALIPPDNATGNFVKVVQRIPVRIKITNDAMSAKLAAGMSASVKVKVTND